MRGLEQNSKLGSDGPFANYSGRLGLDGAIALSIGLTSFISAPGQPVENYRQCRYDASPNTSSLSPAQCPSGSQAEPLLSMPCSLREQPREALDVIIRALERNDDFTFQARLGPDAKMALDSILKNKPWNELRTQLLRQKTSLSDFAVGYQFDVAGAWSAPAETLEYRGSPESPPTPAIDTRFKTRSGADCGTHTVRFLLTPIEGAFWKHYAVNNSDLEDLMQLVASCLAKE